MTINKVIENKNIYTELPKIIEDMERAITILKNEIQCVREIANNAYERAGRAYYKRR